MALSWFKYYVKVSSIIIFTTWKNNIRYERENLKLICGKCLSAIRTHSGCGKNSIKCEKVYKQRCTETDSKRSIRDETLNHTNNYETNVSIKVEMSIVIYISFLDN